MTARPVTRRGWLAAAAAALPAAAQQAAPPPIPSTPAEETAAALAQLKSNFDQLRRVRLPMSTEPAIRFKA